MKGHAQHDDMRYVPKALLAAWAKRDPLDRFERFLIAQGHATKADLEAVTRAIAPELDAAADAAERRPVAAPEETLRGVYSEPGYERPWWPAESAR
jgi:TPP-dependent pyruvate/acetoin dehydrogenase alpha subunit